VGRCIPSRVLARQFPGLFNERSEPPVLADIEHVYRPSQAVVRGAVRDLFASSFEETPPGLSRRDTKRPLTFDLLRKQIREERAARVINIHPTHSHLCHVGGRRSKRTAGSPSGERGSRRRRGPARSC